MTSVDLTELRTLAEAATPGPWEAEDGVFVVADGRPLISRLRDGNGDGFFESAADAEFIAAARSDLPRLIAAARAVLDRARMEQDDAESAMTYAAEINDDLTLASQRSRKQAWADAARAITTALGADDE